MQRKDPSPNSNQSWTCMMYKRHAAWQKKTNFCSGNNVSCSKTGLTPRHKAELLSNNSARLQTFWYYTRYVLIILGKSVHSLLYCSSQTYLFLMLLLLYSDGNVIKLCQDATIFLKILWNNLFHWLPSKWKFLCLHDFFILECMISGKMMDAYKLQWNTRANRQKSRIL